MLDYLGQLDRSIRIFERANVINEAHGNHRTVGSITGSLGLLHRFKGDLTKALQLYRQALEIQKKVGNDYGMSVSLSNAGIVWQGLGDLTAAEGALRRSIAISERLQSAQRIAYGQSYLAQIYLDAGRLEEAEPLLEEAIRSQQAQGQQRDRAVSLRFASRFARIARADPSRSARLAREAVRLKEDLDQPGRRRRLSRGSRGAVGRHSWRGFSRDCATTWRSGPLHETRGACERPGAGCPG